MSIHKKSMNYDVVVVGGGLSGLAAAIASARHGAKTVIIQNRPMFGGTGSSETRMHIVGASSHAAKENLAETGLLMEILLENKRRNPYASFNVFDIVLWEKVKYQENLDFYLNTNLDDAIAVDGNIVKLICHQSTTETEIEVTGKYFVDATGHGTLGTMVGAKGRKGSESKYEFNEPSAPEEANEITMGDTILFSAVDRGEPVKFVKPFWAYTFTEDQLRYRPHDNSITQLEEGGGDVEFDPDKVGLPNFSNIDSGYWWMELGGNYKDIIGEAEDIRDELLKCVYGVWDHLKNVGDHGAQNLDLDWVGIVPGHRESRRLEGDYWLNENDIRENRIFDDAVAYGGWAMDIHTPGGLKDFDRFPSNILNFDGCYTIPYRCYYSKNMKNLFMAGRDISLSKMAFSSARVMGTCTVGGQAVGTAAALAVKYGCTPREVGTNHIRELQQALLKDDCYIPGYKNADEKDLARTAKISASGALEGCEPQNVTNGVARIVGSEMNCWESCENVEDEPNITLDFGKAVALSELRFTFDPDLTRELMPSLTRNVRNRQVKGLPPQLVKDFKIEYIKGGIIVLEKEITDNYMRLCIVENETPVECDRVRVTVKATYGFEHARIFEIRAY